LILLQQKISPTILYLTLAELHWVENRKIFWQYENCGAQIFWNYLCLSLMRWVPVKDDNCSLNAAILVEIVEKIFDCKIASSDALGAM
jgi:hypothetical protein